MTISVLPEAARPVLCDRPGWEERIVESLRDRGIAVYRELHDPQSLLDLAASVGEVFFHRDGDASGFTHISLGEPGVSSPSQFLHTDSAGEAEPPDLLVVHCVAPAPRGGESLLADTRIFCTTLARDHREAFEALSDPSVACIRSGSQLYRGPFLSTLESGRSYFRFRPDNEQVSPLLAEHLVTFMYAAGAASERLVLGAGAGYVAQNERWLHGRTSWYGHRAALRLLINVSPDSRLGHRVPSRGFDLGEH
jgi:hypothetical protein